MLVRSPLVSFVRDAVIEKKNDKIKIACPNLIQPSRTISHQSSNSRSKICRAFVESLLRRNFSRHIFTLQLSLFHNRLFPPSIQTSKIRRLDRTKSPCERKNQAQDRGQRTWPLFRPTTIPERSCAISTVGTTAVGDDGGCCWELSSRWASVRMESRQCLPGFGWPLRACVASLGLRVGRMLCHPLRPWCLRCLISRYGVSTLRCYLLTKIWGQWRG